MKKSKIKFLVIAAFFTAAATFFILSGCKEKKSEIQINFLNHKMEQHDAFLKLAKEFESIHYSETHNKVKFNIESVGGETDYFTKLKSSFASGKGPDIFNISSYAELQEYKSKIKEISDMPLLKDMDGVLKDADNKQYLIPECYEGFGYIARKDIFEKAGVDVNTMKTFKGLNEGFEKLQKALPLKDFPNLKSVLGIAGAESWIFGNHMIIPALNKEFSSAEQAYNSRTFEFKGKDLFKSILDFQLKYAQKENLTSSNYQAVVDNGILGGRYAVTQQGTWLSSKIKEYSKRNKDDKLCKNIVMLPFSTPEDGENEGNFAFYIGQFFALNKNLTEEKHKVVSDFLNFLYKSEKGKKFLTEELGFISPIKNADQKFEEGSLNDTLSKARKEGKIMNGDLSVIRTEQFHVHTLGAAVQKYLNNPTEQIYNTDVVETAKKGWEEIATKQLEKNKS